MKQITLKKVLFGLDFDPDSKTTFDYRDGLMDVLRVREQGMDLVEMEKALSCIGKIKRATTVVVLDDAEHAYLAGRIKEYRWRVADSSILEFVKSVRDATEYIPDAVAEGSL
jgi:hypothetical protein